MIYDYIAEFLVAYLDDVAMYSESLVGHLCHLKKVSSRLREYRLYIKLKKC